MPVFGLLDTQRRETCGDRGFRRRLQLRVGDRSGRQWQGFCILNDAETENDHNQ